MRKLKLFLLTLFLFFSLSFFGFSYAQNNLNQDREPTKDVSPTLEVKSGNYFAGGSNVNFQGTVNRNVYVAGGSVSVGGVINGDLFVAGGMINISGNVQGSVWAAGGQVNVSGNIGGNFTLLGGGAIFSDQSRIGGSLAAAGGSVLVNAPVAKGVNFAGGQLSLGNSVGGDVVAAVGEVVLNSNANIAGDLIYMSDNEAKINSGARVGGVTERRPFPTRPTTTKVKLPSLMGVGIFIGIIDLLSAFIVGILLLLIFPLFMENISSEVGKKLWLNLGAGFLILIFSPIIIISLFFTVIGIPLALILLALFLIAVYLSRIFVSLAAGINILKIFNIKIWNGWSLLLGLVIYEILAQIPFLGGIIVFLVVILGTGALFFGIKELSGKLEIKKD